MNWPTPIKDWIAGVMVTEADLDTEVHDRMTFLYSPPSCRVTNTLAISCGNGSNTVLTFNTERWDNDTIHSTVSNTSRLTAVTAGRYLIFANVEFAANATGARQVFFFFNGTTTIAAIRIPAAASGVTQIPLSIVHPMAVGEYVEVFVIQSSGVSLNVSSVADFSPDFGMHWLGN